MAVQITPTLQNQIANLYIAILGRPTPEPAGFGYWCDLYANNNGTTAALNSITVGFSNSPEFIATYGGQTTSQAITLMYNNVLNRAPDAGGLAYWTTQYTAFLAQQNDVSAALALTGNAIITAAAANTGTADQTLIQGKQATAVASGTSAPTATFTLTTNPDNVGSEFNIANGVMVGTGAAGSTLQIFDTVNMGSGTDTLNLTGTTTAVVSAATAPILGGVEVLNYRNTDASVGNNLAGGIAAELTTLNYVSPLANVRFDGIATTASTLGLSNVATDGVNATFNYAAGLTGTTDAGTLNLTNVGSATGVIGTFANVIINGVTGGLETLNVNATGANRLGAIAVNAVGAPNLGVLNISGTGSFRVDGAVAFGAAVAAPVINASANTGGVNVNTTGAGNVSFTGGSGNDTIAIDLANFTIADTINGGAGTNTLGIFGVNGNAGTTPTSAGGLLISSATTALNAAIAATTNMQNILLSGGAGNTGPVNLAANVLTQTNYTFVSTGTVTVTAIAGDTMTLQENGFTANAASFTSSLGTTALSLNINAANGLAAGSSVLTASGFTTVALGLNTDSTGGAFTQATNFAIDSNTAVTATGNAAFTTTFVQAAGVGVVYNGSAATGIQTITGTARADSITGGANADVLAGGAGNDTIVGGAGNDTLTGGLGADTITTGAGVDIVVFTAGNPDIVVPAVLVSQADSVLTGVTGAITAANIATVTRAWDIVTADAGDVLDVNTGTGAVVGSLAVTGTITNNGTTASLMGDTLAAGAAVYWNDGTNTYLVINSQTSGAASTTTIDVLDTMIVLTGVRTLTGAAGAGGGDFTIVS